MMTRRKDDVCAVSKAFFVIEIIHTMKMVEPFIKQFMAEFAMRICCSAFAIEICRWKTSVGVNVDILRVIVLDLKVDIFDLSHASSSALRKEAHNYN